MKPKYMAILQNGAYQILISAHCHNPIFDHFILIIIIILFSEKDKKKWWWW
jgi:hypothetical protein